MLILESGFILSTMNFVEIFSSKKFFVSLAIIVSISLLLTPFPLIGILGFEFSLIIAFAGAFISVFISAESINLGLGKDLVKSRRLSDVVSSVLLMNFVLIFLPFVVGLLSSIMQEACYIKEGIIFYLLIPVVTVFFSSSLGLLCGTVFDKKGFLLGSLALIAVVLFSLWRLYSEPPVFSYNPVFGFFPGPIYDEAIPITSTLIISRVIVVFWGLLFLNIIWILHSFKHKTLGLWNIFTFLALILVLFVSHLKKEELGITHTRDYITENTLSASFETEHFVIYYDPGADDRDIALIAGDHEWRYRQLKRFLRVGSKDKIRSYIYPDTETRKRVIGAGDTTIANPIHREIHLVYDSFPNPVLKHELVHVMASEFGTSTLRISPKVGLIEGIAVAADWGGGDFSPHEWSRAMIEAGSAPDINDIVGIGFWYAPGSKSYTLMGSFSRYLIEGYGIEKFKKLYRTGDFSVYGKTLEGLVSEWKSFLQNVPVPERLRALTEYKFSQPGIFQGKCPRRIAELREKGMNAFRDENFYEAKKSFLQALTLDDSDPVIIGSLAYSYYYDKDYRELFALIRKSESLAEVDTNIMENLRGNALWQTGNFEKARAVFESLAAKTVPGDVRREIAIKLSAISSGGEVERKMREYFGTRDRVSQVAALGEIIGGFPGYAPAYYLLGRIFFNNGDYGRAASYFLKSESLGLASENLEKENLWLLGVSLFATGDYEGAIKKFRRFVGIEPDGAAKDNALDFIRRCEWAIKVNSQ